MFSLSESWQFCDFAVISGIISSFSHLEGKTCISLREHTYTIYCYFYSCKNDNFRYFEILLAHLSRRLIGELIVYPCSGVRRRCRRCCCRRCRRPPFSNVFFSETAWQIKAKFYVEAPWKGGTKVCINGPCHMTEMAAMPIYGKNL